MSFSPILIYTKKQYINLWLTGQSDIMVYFLEKALVYKECLVKLYRAIAQIKKVKIMEERKMFKVKCSECGEETEVPFQPDGERPVYCRDCFQKHRKPRRDF